SSLVDERRISSGEKTVWEIMCSDDSTRVRSLSMAMAPISYMGWRMVLSPRNFEIWMSSKPTMGIRLSKSRMALRAPRAWMSEAQKQASGRDGWFKMVAMAEYPACSVNPSRYV